MAQPPARTTLESINSLLSNAKEILQDARNVAHQGGQGETLVQLLGLSQAITDIQADVRARMKGRS